jgi:hypothetical protein
MEFNCPNIFNHSRMKLQKQGKYQTTDKVTNWGNIYIVFIFSIVCIISIANNSVCIMCVILTILTL